MTQVDDHTVSSKDSTGEVYNVPKDDTEQQMPTVTLAPITRTNWRAALALEVHPTQQHFVADHVPIAALVLAKAYVGAAGLTWEPYAIMLEPTMVGFVALAYAPQQRDWLWIYHLFIDHRQQGQRYGTAALAALLVLVRARHTAYGSLRLTVHPDNRVAHRLYTAAGFEPTGELQDGEPVYTCLLPR